MPSKKQKLLRYILKNKQTPAQNRARVGQSLTFLSVFIFFVFLINFAIIIGTDQKFGVDLSEGAKRVHQTTVTVQAKRGTIYDRTGMPIAEDSTTYTVYAVVDKNYVSASGEPLYVQKDHFNKVAKIFKKHLDMKESFVIEQLNLPNLYQIYFGVKGKNISYSTMNAILADAESAGIKGISFSTSPGRMYPNGNFASFFIGLAQLEDNKDGSQSLKGQTGLENALNAILSGQDGKIRYEKDSSGRIIPGTETVEREKRDGQDVYTTLSTELQRSLETNMDVFYEKTKGKLANATLVSAKTGEILATAQRPSFDADTKKGLTKDLVWRSQLYQENFEPGSTMKVMTVAAAIDNGSFRPHDTYVNNGYTIADRTINDWMVNGGKDPMLLNYIQGFTISSNVGMLRLQHEMGDAKWLDYLAKFRFGYPTRFGMGGEEAGILPADNIVSIGMSSFGQAISVTQVQMLRAFSAIGNDGIMLEPKFISALYDPNTDSSRISQKEVVGNPVSAKAAQDTRQYMIGVGTDPYYGTLYSSYAGGAVIKVDGYNVAVKSGTAEIAKDDGTGYVEGANAVINSVVAMVPAENPEFIMYVTLREPEAFSLLNWQDIVNPVLKEAMLLKDSLNLEGPAATLSMVRNETAYAMPDVVGQTPGDTADQLRRQLVQPIIIGHTNTIKKTSVPIGENLVANQQVLLYTGKPESMPDMYGWTKENVEQFSEWTKIEVVFEGEGGKVIEQNIETGKSIKKTKKIKVTLGE
ncbi:penicillin-binding protein PBP2X [Streptococcus cameli]